ncbi:unnamed protein product [Orchesella dallaii]|uniref:CUB domain-containing protein n=1 Tax=Orchesella dallaii TaxID=48710 RepID=A0ABP1Q715_9HEXA
MTSITLYFILFLNSLLFLPIYADSISPFASNCGEILSGESGAISYKPFEQFRAGERCVWVIRVPHAVSYNVVLYNSGMGSRGYNKVIVTALSRDKAEVHTDLSLIDRNYFIDGSVAIVTFYAYEAASSTGAGFSLYYEAAVLSENNHVSPYSFDYVISSNAAEMRHPAVGGSYSHNELSTFVFTPNFLWVNNQRLTVNVTVLGMEQNCDDMITVYYLPDSSYKASWRKVGRICGFENRVMLSNTGVILLVFQSDESLENNGFQLTYYST